MCLDDVSESQVDTLRGYKATRGADFPDWAREDYANLVAFDITAVPAPMTISESELLFLYETEEIIDNLRMVGSTASQ